MKRTPAALASMAALAVVLGPGVARSESTYGYRNGAAAGVEASARLNVAVKIPTLILLRVGEAGTTISTAALDATLSGVAIPLAGGGTFSPTTEIDRGSVSWSGVSPTFTATPATVQAYAWTNARSGGHLSRANALFSPADLALTAVKVDSTALGSTLLSHPGSTLDTSVPVTIDIARNTLMSANWVFSIDTASTNLGSVPAGEYTVQVTYTAVTL